MQAWVSTYGRTIIGAASGARQVLRRGAKGRCRFDESEEFEDPGWPDGTRVRVVEATSSQLLLEPEDSTLRPKAGLMGRAAQFVLKHGLLEGAPTMVGDVYQVIVIQTEYIAAGPNSDTNRSKVVFGPEFIIAKDEATAGALVLAAAAKKGIDINDPAKPVEVKPRKF